MAHRCENLHCLLGHVPRLKRKQSVLLSCLRLRVFMACVSIAASRSSLRCSVRGGALGLPFVPLPLPLPLYMMAGFGRGCSNVCTSLLTFVSSCIASSRVQLSVVSAMIMISDQIFLSALRSSAVLTVRRPVSGCSDCVQRS